MEETFNQTVVPRVLASSHRRAEDLPSAEAHSLSGTGSQAVRHSSALPLPAFCLEHLLHRTLHGVEFLIPQHSSLSCRQSPVLGFPTYTLIIMSGLFGSAAPNATSANSTTGDISKDVALSNPPEDGVSDLSFSPQSEHLAVASWDKKVRIYEINAQGGSEGKALFDHEGPVLSCCWSKVGYLHRHLSTIIALTHFVRMAQR